jgi:cellulose biosynthesis protein BcsQ
MKIAILNYCGTVGKTTLATNLFQPRMNNSKIIAVETINMSANELHTDAEVIKINRFREIYQQILIEDNLVIDVGSSNIESFLSNMVTYENAHTEIDYYILPVTQGEKEQRETMNTVLYLIDLGIDAKKIKILFNKINVMQYDVKDTFHKIFTACSKKHIPINDQLYIYETELFDELINAKITLEKAINDTSDYKKMIKEATEQKEKLKFANMLAIKSLANNMHNHFDSLFNKIFEHA